MLLGYETFSHPQVLTHFQKVYKNISISSENILLFFFIFFWEYWFCFVYLKEIEENHLYIIPQRGIIYK